MEKVKKNLRTFKFGTFKSYVRR